MRIIDQEIIEELLCRRVSLAITKIAPPGIGNWPGLWSRVKPANDRFLELLPTYHGDELAKKQVEEAGNDVVRAWKAAVRDWLNEERSAA
jgi:hypothetical protein